MLPLDSGLRPSFGFDIRCRSCSNSTERIDGAKTIQPKRNVEGLRRDHRCLLIRGVPIVARDEALQPCHFMSPVDVTRPARLNPAPATVLTKARNERVMLAGLRVRH